MLLGTFNFLIEILLPQPMIRYWGKVHITLSPLGPPSFLFLNIRPKISTVEQFTIPF